MKYPYIKQDTFYMHTLHLFYLSIKEYSTWCNYDHVMLCLYRDLTNECLQMIPSVQFLWLNYLGVDCYAYKNGMCDNIVVQVLTLTQTLHAV